MNLLKSNKRFSFKLDGTPAWELEHSVSVEEKENELIMAYTFGGGLKITNIARKYSKHGAYEWVNYLENVGDQPTGVISELFDCNITLPLEHEDTRKPPPTSRTKILRRRYTIPRARPGTRLNFQLTSTRSAKTTA